MYGNAIRSYPVVDSLLNGIGQLILWGERL
jgi:hypothetical protein